MEEHMIHLADVKGLVGKTPDSTLSLYLNVDPTAPENQAMNPAWHTWAKNALRDLGNGLKAEETANWTHVRDRTQSYLDAYKPSGKGLALFYGRDFERVYELPIAFENQAVFGKPLILPLLWAMEEYQPYVIVMVDHEKAHFIAAQLGSTERLESIALDLDTSDWAHKTIRSASGAASRVTLSNARDAFDQRVEIYQGRFHGEVGEHALKLAESLGSEHIIIAGNEQAAQNVRKQLPESAAHYLVGVMPITMRAADHEVLTAVLPMALEYERQREMKLVDDLIDMAKARGRAALGIVAVEHALDQQRVELLVVPWPVTNHYLAQEIPFRLLTAGGKIELVHGAAAERLNTEGGIAARLYYTI
jgi:hypothetical protein